MDVAGKLTALENIYRIYDEFADSLELACKKHCAHCCTTSVTLTTIEGYHIIQQLNSERDADWLGKIVQAAEQPHFQPKITTNRLAQLCAQGMDAPSAPLAAAAWYRATIAAGMAMPISTILRFRSTR